MLTLPDLQAAEVDLGAEIEMFATVCATHRVSCGAAADLLAFSWQITSQPDFAADLAALVARIQLHGRLAHPFADILSIFLIGVGGPSAVGAGLEFQSSTDMMINFLVALDGWSEADLQYATELADGIRDDLSREPTRDRTFDQPQSELTTESALHLDEDTGAGPVTGGDLHEVIARLERSNQELRQKLEAMDERIRRIDPQTDNPRTDTLTYAAPTPGPAQPPKQPPHPVRTPRSALDPAVPHPPDEPARPSAPVHTRTRLLTDQEHLADQRRISAPLRRRRLLQAAVFTTAVLAAGGGVFYSSQTRHDPSAHGDMEGANPPTATARGPQGAAPGADPSGNTTDDGPTSSEATSAPPQHVTIYSVDPKSPVTGSRRKPTAAIPDGSTSPAALNSIVPRPKTPARATDPSEPVSVSSSIMAERLLSSTPPAYPRLARLTSLQGVVVLRATIARDGSVERVHALGGNYLLRSAAANAVRNWRYKPYYLNGKPVEVATLVTIDFALSR